MTPKMLCESPEAMTLLPFLEEVFSYEFEQAPDYSKLSHMLKSCLKKEGKKLDNIYDWNEEYEIVKQQERQQVLINMNKIQDPDMDIDFKESPSNAIDKMQNYQFYVNPNHAVLKNEDSVMYSKDDVLMDS